MEETALRRERKICSALGLMLLAVLLCSVVWSFLMSGLYYMTNGAIPYVLYLALTLVGHYVLSLPLAFRMVRRVPRVEPARRPVEPLALVRWIVIGLSLTWVGALVGVVVNQLIYLATGRVSSNDLDQIIDMMPVGLVVLCVSVIAPVCEEIVFRYLLAGRLARYGQASAAFISALLFAAFHGNFSQFFLAFAAGLLLAYAYFRTGRLLVPILIHMAVNFSNSGVALLLPPSDTAYALYGFVSLVITVAGIALLICGRRDIRWDSGWRKPTLRAVFLNPGMVLIFAACFAEFAMTAFLY